jgi:hypothetical protein
MQSRNEETKDPQRKKYSFRGLNFGNLLSLKILICTPHFLLGLPQKSDAEMKNCQEIRNPDHYLKENCITVPVKKNDELIRSKYISAN